MNEIHYLPRSRVADEVSITVCKSGGLATVLAVVAAVAIPVIAPAIVGAATATGGVLAGTTLGTALSTTVGQYVGSAIVGAALGGVTAELSGGKFSDGAKTGGLAGLAGRAFSGPLNAGETAGAAQAGNTQAGFGSGQQVGGEGWSATTTGDIHARLYGPGGAPPGAIAPQGGFSNFVGDVRGQMDAIQQQAAVTNGPNSVAATTSPNIYKETLKMALVQMAGNAIFPPGLTEEQEELVKMQMQELRELKVRNRRAYDMQMETAQSLLSDAEQFDPGYQATLSANKASITAQRGNQTQQRKAALTGRGYSPGDRRRAGLDAGRATSGAYDSGYTAGISRRNSAITAASNAIPKGSTTYSRGLSTLTEQRDRLTDRQDEYRGNFVRGYGQLFGVPDYHNQDEEERDRRAAMAGALG